MAIAFWFVTLGLLLAAVLVAIVAWLLGRRAGRTARVPVANSRRLTSLPSYRRAITRSTTLLALGGAVLVVLLAVTAVAGGRWVYQRVEQPEKYNRDIVLCLDVSGSMVDYDVQVIDRYLEMLPDFDGERMSLVLWDSTAVQVFPLTDDYGFVEDQLTEVRNDMATLSGRFWVGTQGAPGASLVGDGLASCALMFDGQEDDGRSRSIILATDNAVNGSPIVSLPQAAAYASVHKIKVYGLDANEFEDAFSDEYRTSVLQHGGVYYKLGDESSVRGIVDKVTTDQTNAILGAPQVLIVDRPAGWLIAMLVLFAAYLGLRLAVRR